MLVAPEGPGTRDATAASPVLTGSADPLAAAAGAAVLRTLLDGGAVQPLFQPIVDLSTGAVRGFEALVRGPRGHRLERPDALFAAARAAGVLPALDAGCVAGALMAVRDGGLSPTQTLFLNIEPDSHIIDVLPELAEAISCPVVVELTERTLTVDPAEMLATVALVRRFGWGVALDDVGVNPDSLALLPLISPDVIKLDISLLHRPPTAHTAHVFSAVAAEVERSGCLIVAEGVETTAHLHAARALGADLGQGWLFGPAGRLPAASAQPVVDRLVLRAPPLPETARTPFAVISVDREVRTATKPLLTAMSEHLERQATAIGESCLVLATFRTAEAFAPAADRYSVMAGRNAYVAAFGCGIAPFPAPGVHGVDLLPHEPLARGWSVVIVGPHYAVVLAAQPADDAAAADAHWNYVLSHDRDLAVRAAAVLMNRMTRRPLTKAGR